MGSSFWWLTGHREKEGLEGSLHLLSSKCEQLLAKAIWQGFEWLRAGPFPFLEKQLRSLCLTWTKLVARLQWVIAYDRCRADHKFVQPLPGHLAESVSIQFPKATSQSSQFRKSAAKGFTEKKQLPKIYQEAHLRMLQQQREFQARTGAALRGWFTHTLVDASQPDLPSAATLVRAFSKSLPSPGFI
jgi:hypothetical protein